MRWLHLLRSGAKIVPKETNSYLKSLELWSKTDVFLKQLDDGLFATSRMLLDHGTCAAETITVICAITALRPSAFVGNHRVSLETTIHADPFFFISH